MEHPDPITTAERAKRLRRTRRLARRVGFVGRVEYRHVYSNSGGAQFGVGSTSAQDLLIVYAEAFVRDADPDDFSLDAIIAHERGHQVVCRNPALQTLLSEPIGAAAEEILASLVGSVLTERRADNQSLLLKALDDAIERGLEPAEAVTLISELQGFLERIL